MKTYISILFILFMMSSSYAQIEILDQFQGNTHYFKGTKIPFRLFVPTLNSTDDSVGLVLALHGSGSNGNDNLAQIRDCHLATYWAQPLVQSQYPSFILVPQCPSEMSWSNKNVYENVINMLDSIINLYPIDSKRIYVTGLSLGGNGTWSMLDQYPEKFAAAAPVCGWYNYSKDFIEKIKNVPIWNFHGQNDQIVGVESSRSMVIAYDRIGYPFVCPICLLGDCNYFTNEQYQEVVDGPFEYLYYEIPGVGHEAWDIAYVSPYLFKWMFSKVRRSEKAINLSGFDSYGQIVGTTKISWIAQNLGDSVEVWFSPDLENSWIKIGKSIASTGSIPFNSELVNDCAFGTIKLLIRNRKGFINGTARSVPQAINNEGNSAPFLKISLDCKLRMAAILADSIPVNMKVGDAENDSLTVRIFYSTDSGNTYTPIDTLNMTTSIEYQTYWLVLKNLLYSKEARVKIEVNDGSSSTSYLSDKFENKKGIKVIIGSNPAFDENMSTVLEQNYPNPFTSNTTIPWQLAHSSRATLKVFDLVGREVSIPVDEERPAGKYETEFNATTIPKGIYFYQLKAGDFCQTRKMVLVK
jgi:predicted esterase